MLNVGALGQALDATVTTSGARWLVTPRSRRRWRQTSRRERNRRGVQAALTPVILGASAYRPATVAAYVRSPGWLCFGLPWSSERVESHNHQSLTHGHPTITNQAITQSPIVHAKVDAAEAGRPLNSRCGLRDPLVVRPRPSAVSSDARIQSDRRGPRVAHPPHRSRRAAHGRDSRDARLRSSS
jgi:hypothetical protein